MPALVTIGAVSNSDYRYLHARGLYVDYLEKEATDAITAAKATTSCNTATTSPVRTAAESLSLCVLKLLPFTSINLTEIADWRLIFFVNLPVAVALAITAVIAGLIGLAASVSGLVIGVMPRHFSAAEQQRIMSWEVGKRWRAWPAGKIFPATITYRVPAGVLASKTGLGLSARRVGIASQAPCAAATS